MKWGGAFENLERATGTLLIVVPIALFLIFVMLFSTFNSAKQALMIYTGIPFAIVGGVIALALRGMPFSISAGVGFIALFGVAVLNGVVMVSFINHLREEGKSVLDAVKVRCNDQTQTCFDDRFGGKSRIYPDGSSDKRGRGSAASAGDGRHRRFNNFDAFDAAYFADSLRLV